MDDLSQEITLVVAGPAGGGIQTIEQLMVNFLKNSGYNVFATKEYESRIRGGTNSIEIRISSNRVQSFVEKIDLLIPLTSDSIEHLKSRISENTLIIMDPMKISKEVVDSNTNIKKENVLEIKVSDIAKSFGNILYSNIVVTGILVGLFSENDEEIEKAKDVIRKHFKTKSEEIVSQNIEAFSESVKTGRDLKTSTILNKLKLTPKEHVKNEILLNGNQAVAWGAIAGGCNFISAYPMSPSTGVLITLAKNSNEFEIVIDQAEDEIAAINKNIAAWYAGARAIASTSGGGFALMTEGLSLAGITEVPIVVHIAQRPGPATGLPTRTAQEDLNLTVYAGHGEFMRMIFAPGTIEQAFYLTQNAFNLADQYQVPVFILTDQNFVDAYYNIEELDLEKIENKNYFVKTDKDYKRYLLTEDGISPRGVPGYGEGLVRVDSDEHDESGQITEDMDYIRPRMVEKRVHMRKKLLESVMEPPTIIGDPDYTTLIVTWGSNYHAIKEAIEELDRESGIKSIAMAHFHQVFPLNPTVVQRILGKAQQLYIVESNATGQFANILKTYADISIEEDHKFLDYSGKPFSVERIKEFIQNEVLKIE